MKKIKNLAFETSNQSSDLSVEMMNLKVIYKAVADLDDRIEEIIHNNWDEDITMARLSIDEIKNSVRLVNMAFHPLLTSMIKNVKELKIHSSELFCIVQDQADENKKSPFSGN